MEQPTLILDLLSDEILLKIFSHNLPEDISLMHDISKKYYALLSDNLFWETRFKCHFPYAYAKTKLNNPASWYNQFIYEYKTDYEKLTKEIKLLFSIAKEGSLEGLKGYISEENNKINWLSDLVCVDANGISVLEWIRINQHQVLLDNIYNWISKIDYSSPITLNKTIKLSCQSVIWPIVCRQPTSEIISRINSNRNSIHDVWLNQYQSIHLAAKDNRPDVIEKLIDFGVMVDAKCYQDKTALHCAAETGSLEAGETLLRLGANVNDKAYYGMKALHYAAAKGHDAAIEILLKTGKVNLDEYDHCDQTALTYAVIYNHVGTARLLLSHKANINIAGYRGLKTIHLVAKMGDARTIQLAIDLGADINAIDKQGLKPLHHAAKIGNYNATEYLISLGASVNTTDADGMSPLHHAACASRFDNDNLLALHNQLYRNFKATYFYPTQAGFNHIIKFPWVKTVEILLQHKANPNMFSGWPEDVKIVIEYGSTPLHIASYYRNTEIMEVLLRSGADMNIVGQHKGSPISLAVVSTDPRLENLETLLKYANDKNLSNAKLQEFLKQTLDKKNLKVFRLLSMYTVENYISKTKQRGADDRGKFLFWETGYTAGEKLAAANALLEVIRDGKLLSIIQPFEDVLNQGELGKIYTSALPIINLIKDEPYSYFSVYPKPTKYI